MAKEVKISDEHYKLVEEMAKRSNLTNKAIVDRIIDWFIAHVGVNDE